MTAAEINEQIKQTKAQIGDLENKKRYLTIQYRDALQAEFEAKHNVKAGDKIRTYNHTTYYYGGFTIDANGDVMVLCYPVKKDGGMSHSKRYVSESNF